MCGGSRRFVTGGPQTGSGGRCSHVSAGYVVVRADGSVDSAGGKENVEWFAGGGSEQRCDLRDRAQNSAVRLHPRERVLHWGVRGELAVVEARTGNRGQGAGYSDPSTDCRGGRLKSELGM